MDRSTKPGLWWAFVAWGDGAQPLFHQEQNACLKTNKNRPFLIIRSKALNPVQRRLCSPSENLPFVSVVYRSSSCGVPVCVDPQSFATVPLSRSSPGCGNTHTFFNYSRDKKSFMDSSDWKGVWRQKGPFSEVTSAFVPGKLKALQFAAVALASFE